MTNRDRTSSDVLREQEADVLHLLRATSLFASTPAETLQRIAGRLAPVRLAANDVVFEKGDRGDSLYLVASGGVRVYDGDTTLDELEPGAVFGEMAVLDDETRSASVAATRDTLLYRLEQDAFFGLLAERPEVTRGVVRVLSGRLRARMRIAAEDHRSIARLLQASREADRMTRELALASQVQSSFLPERVPDPPGWEFAAGWIPARELSGDFYDFLPLDDRLGLAIADVADKGMPAALFMTLTRSVLRSSAQGSPNPARIVTQANRLLAADAADGMFVTLFFAILDPASGAFSYVNAGHNPPLLLRAAGGAPEWLERTGILVGWDDTAEFGASTTVLEPGDVVVLYTDGVTEARNPAGEEFGDERLAAALERHRHERAPVLLEALQSEVRRFADGVEFGDDSTLVVLQRTPA